MGQRHPMALGHQDRKQVAPALSEYCDLLGRLVRQWAQGRTYRVRKVRQNASIEGIRFRQVPCRFGTIADLARVDDGQGELDHSQGCDQGTLPAPSRFAHDECGLQLAQACDPRGDAIVIVGNTPAGGPRTAGNSKVLLRDIKTTKTGSTHLHNLLLLVRPELANASCKLGQLYGLVS
jgi:hypothetical protein